MTAMLTKMDQFRAFASSQRVFTRAEMISILGKGADAAISKLAGDQIIRHARGVYSVANIASDDPRVCQKIAEAGAKPLSDAEREEAARKGEELAASTIRSSMRKAPKTTEIARHFAKHPVASSSELARIYGRAASSAIRALCDRGKVERVRDGLWVRAGVEHYGPEMKAYIEQNNIEFATVRREIEQFDEIVRGLAEGGRISWNISRPTGRGLTIYMNISKDLSIYAQSRKGNIHWHAVKKVVSSEIARQIAAMVLNPMPEHIGELIELVQSGMAPRNVRRRHGGYRDYRQPEPDDRTAMCGSVEKPRYGLSDTHVLEPRLMGNGLPESVFLEIDDREDDRLVSLLMPVHNLHVIRTRLDVADFVARCDNKTLLIERKTSDDLTASLLDNRMTDQVRRMNETGYPSCFIIEGGITGSRRIPLPKLVSIQTRLTFGYNMPVLETLDIVHTARVIVTAIRNCFFENNNEIGFKPAKPTCFGPMERAISMLTTVPGVSSARAAMLIEHFGSLAGISQATAKEIAQIKGVGPKTAAQLYEVLHAAGVRPAELNS